MSAEEREFGFDVDIEEITIYKKNGRDTLQIYPNPEEFGEGDPLLIGFTLTTDIFTPGMTGKVKFREPGTLGTAFNINASEYVMFKVKNPGIEDSTKQFKMCVENIHFVGDLATEGGFSNFQKQGVGWEVNLIACESYINNWGDSGYQEEGFIGKIASEENWEPSGEQGLVNQLAGQFENFTDIENTKNTIWLKKNHMTYPWGKDTPSQNLTAMLNTLTEYAVTEDGLGVNYCFWQDLDGWHFKSVRKIIQEGVENDAADATGPGGEGGKGKREYVVTDDLLIPPDKWNPGHPRIHSIVSTSEWNHIGAWQFGAYSSFYEYVKPNYSDPYWQYMDFVTTHQKRGANEYGEREIITYDYHRDSQQWGGYSDGGRIETYKLLPEPKGSELFGIEYGKDAWDTKNPEDYPSRDAFVNPVYGYYSHQYNTSNPNPLDKLASSYTQGKYGPTEPHLWQEMNDATDLKASTIWTIENKIKKPTRETYKKYIEKKNLKEKWDVYRHSVCCDKGDVEKFQFLAVIDDAKIVQDNDRGGIYKYSWREVEMWPTDDIQTMHPDNPPLTEDDAPITIATVPGGMEGSIDDEATMSAAWNINELFNSTEGDNVFVGPGINVADDDFNDYPEAYQMMPVGGYFKVDDNPCEVEDGADVYFHKHLVQMYKVPMYVLEGMTATGDIDNNAGDEPVEIFFFDVPNAHDGLCNCP